MAKDSVSQDDLQRVNDFARAVAGELQLKRAVTPKLLNANLGHSPVLDISFQSAVLGRVLDTLGVDKGQAHELLCRPLKLLGHTTLQDFVSRGLKNG